MFNHSDILILKMMKCLLLSLLFVSSVFGGRVVHDNNKYHTSRLIVGTDVSSLDVDVLETKYGVKVNDVLTAGSLVLDVTDKTSVDEKIKTLKSSQMFKYVEPDFVATSLVQDGSSSPDLYGMDKISMPCVWSKITDSSTNARVCVIDTGVSYTHPDLSTNMWQNPWEKKLGPGIDNDLNGYVDDVYGINAITNTGNATDDHGHGTHVAGTIGAIKNGVGVVGVSPKSSIIPCKFLSASGSGYYSDAIKCLKYCKTVFDKYRTSNSSKYQYTGIYSNSWGGYSYSQALYDAIKDLDTGATQSLFVAAAGNSALNADTTPMYPAGYNLPNILSVAATDSNDNLASFSNYGVNSVHLAAPGVSITSTFLSNGYASMSGTSMATPHVAGVATLMAYKKLDATSSEIKTVLMSGVDKVSGLSTKVKSGGRLNALKSLNILLKQNKSC